MSLVLLVSDISWLFCPFHFFRHSKGTRLPGGDGKGGSGDGVVVVEMAIKICARNESVQNENVYDAGLGIARHGL